mgnify:CR=1 FL=1
MSENIKKNNDVKKTENNDMTKNKIPFVKLLYQ